MTTRSGGYTNRGDSCHFRWRDRPIVGIWPVGACPRHVGTWKVVPVGSLEGKATRSQFWYLVICQALCEGVAPGLAQLTGGRPECRAGSSTRLMQRDARRAASIGSPSQHVVRY
jgi:hypothetical protein